MFVVCLLFVGSTGDFSNEQLPKKVTRCTCSMVAKPRKASVIEAIEAWAASLGPEEPCVDLGEAWMAQFSFW